MAERTSWVVGLFMDLSERTSTSRRRRSFGPRSPAFEPRAARQPFLTFEPGARLHRYYLATAFETVIVQPSGLVELGGVHIDIPLARRILDEYGIKPISMPHEYKRRCREPDRKHAAGTDPPELHRPCSIAVRPWPGHRRRSVPGAASIKAFADGDRWSLPKRR